MINLRNKKIIVTGGAGFLGKYVVKKLKERNCKEIFVPIIDEYDLRDINEIKRMYHDANADIVIHLAAIVGGIGANRENPGSFFYDNLIMGVQLMEQARLNNIEKFVASIKELANKIREIIGFKGKIVWDTTKPDGQPRRCLDTSRAEKEFGFKAKTKFDGGLGKMIEWYIDNNKYYYLPLAHYLPILIPHP